MARKPQPGGDRNAWGGVLNEFLNVAHETDGSIKPAGVQFAVETQVNTALGVQLVPAVEDAMASSTTLAAAVESGVAANPTISANTAAINRVKSQAYDVRDYVSDATGTTDVTAEVQGLLNTAPAGSTILFPQGTKLKLSYGLLVSKANQQLVGPGELMWTGLNRGIAATDAIRVTGNGVTIDGLRLTGYVGDLYARAMEVHANDFTIQNCAIDNWSNGVRQMPGGEYRGFIASQNIITNIYGVGRGTGEEATGDGILATGMDVIITNNVVRAKDGADARAGIVIEALGGSAANPVMSYSTDVSNSSFVVSGNIVSGSFRRAIHAEGVSDYVITNNVCYGMGWWGIIAWSTQRGRISNNMINWTRTSAAPDPEIGVVTSGSLERRAALFVLVSWNVRIYDNTITMNAPARVGLPNVVELYENVHVSFEQNDIFADGTYYEGSGVFITRAFSGVTRVRDNVIRGAFFQGIRLSSSSGGKIFITGNSVEKVDAFDQCILIDGVTGLLVIADNNTSGGVRGIRVNNGSNIIAKHNTLTNCTTGIEFIGGTGMYAPQNTFYNVSTKVIGATSTTDFGP